VNLIDHDNLEGVRTELLDRFVLQRLHHREDVTTNEGLLAVSKDLAKVWVLEDRGIRRPALIEDAPAMRDEEQLRLAPELIAEAAIVERRHHGLACAGRGDEQVPVAVVAVALGLQLLEHPCLMRLGSHVKRDVTAAEISPFGPSLAVQRFA
jgi:hypothetical protein